MNNNENNNLITFQPDDDPTKGCYQGLNMIADFQRQLQDDTVELDSTIQRILNDRFDSRKIRKMTDENALIALKVLEESKQARTKTYLSFLSTLMSEDFYRKQLELERQRLIPIEDGDDSQPELIRTRKEEKMALRLLQDAVQAQLQQDDDE